MDTLPASVSHTPPSLSRTPHTSTAGLTRRHTGAGVPPQHTAPRSAPRATRSPSRRQKWEKLESQASFPLQGAGGGKLEPSGDWRKRLGRGAWNNQPTTHFSSGQAAGSSQVPRWSGGRETSSPRTGAGRSRAGGLRTTSLESFPGLSEGPPRPGPREPSPQPLTWTPPSGSAQLHPSPAPGTPLQPCPLSVTGLKAPIRFLLPRAHSSETQGPRGLLRPRPTAPRDRLQKQVSGRRPRAAGRGSGSVPVGSRWRAGRGWRFPYRPHRPPWRLGPAAGTWGRHTPAGTRHQRPQRPP